MLPCQFPFDKAAQNAHVQREYQRCKTSHGTLLCQWADEPVAGKTSSITNLEKLSKVLFDSLCTKLAKFTNSLNLVNLMFQGTEKEVTISIYSLVSAKAVVSSLPFRSTAAMPSILQAKVWHSWARTNNSTSKFNPVKKFNRTRCFFITHLLSVISEYLQKSVIPILVILWKEKAAWLARLVKTRLIHCIT